MRLWTDGKYPKKENAKNQEEKRENKTNSERHEAVASDGSDDDVTACSQRGEIHYSQEIISFIINGCRECLVMISDGYREGFFIFYIECPVTTISERILAVKRQ